MISMRIFPNGTNEGTISNEERVLITQSMKEVNQIMESYVGIVRSNTRLTRAWNRLDILYEETEKLFKSSKATRELCELRNMINVGYLITRQAMERKESRGLHYTIDYPHAQTIHHRGNKKGTDYTNSTDKAFRELSCNRA